MAAYAFDDHRPIALQRPAPRLGEESDRIRGAIERVLASGRFVRGPEVDFFESELGRAFGVDHVIGVGSGSDALELSLRALGIGRGCRVVTVANAGYYATAAICRVGAEPVFVDTDRNDALIDGEHLERALANGVDAVVLTHLYGNAGRVSLVAEACRRAGVPLVEDCAQAAGALVEGRAAGAWGEIAAMSFYPTKNLAALGDGGAVLTSDTALADRVRQMANHGWGRRFEVLVEGGNSRLDEVQAAILRVRLATLERDNQRRRQIWTFYRDALVGAPARMVGDASTPAHVAHLAVVSTDGRDRVRARMTEWGIETDVHYPIPDHRQPVRGARISRPHLPVTDAMASRVLSIPAHPSLTDADVERVATTLVKSVQR